MQTVYHSNWKVNFWTSIEAFEFCYGSFYNDLPYLQNRSSLVQAYWREWSAKYIAYDIT